MANMNEAARLDTLRRLDLLDTPPSEAFDRITRMAARLFDLPIAAVSLTDSDRQWFKSRVGIEHWSIPRLRAPCATVSDHSATLVVPDLLQDEYFQHSHLAASGIRFYAGAPLTTHDGYCLGAMCVLGTEPRQATESEQAALADLAAMVMAQIELQHALGRIDPMSGLPNRNQLLEDFADLEKDRPAGERRLFVLVNLASAAQLASAARVMGSSYLDGLVGEAVRSFRTGVAHDQKMYHLGATQFAMLAPPGMAEIECVALVRQWLNAHDQWATSRFVTTPAVGIAPFMLGEIGCMDVLRIAQNAVEDAFTTGDHISIYSAAQDDAYRRRFTLLNEFGRALEQPDQLRLVYQPRVDLRTGACVGAEALLRWTHPVLGEISPGEFMPVVEQTSMARAATVWVLDTALAQLRAWRADGIDLALSVNVCAPNLLESDFAGSVARRLARHGVPPGRLELELTETTAMENLDAVHGALQALHESGVRIAIDDFGTGYSSLAYLQTIPAHVIKIDQSFIRGMEHDERRRALVSAMKTLSHDLGHRVVAEGVETAAAHELVRAVGCDEAQGYLYARPLAPPDLAAWLAARTEGAQP